MTKKDELEESQKLYEYLLQYSGKVHFENIDLDMVKGCLVVSPNPNFVRQQVREALDKVANISGVIHQPVGGLSNRECIYKSDLLAKLSQIKKRTG